LIVQPGAEIGCHISVKHAAQGYDLHGIQILQKNFALQGRRKRKLKRILVLRHFLIAVTKVLNDAVFKKNFEPFFRAIVEIDFGPYVFFGIPNLQFVRVCMQLRMTIK